MKITLQCQCGRLKTFDASSKERLDDKIARSGWEHWISSKPQGDSTQLGACPDCKYREDAEALGSEP